MKPIAALLTLFLGLAVNSAVVNAVKPAELPSLPPPIDTQEQPQLYMLLYGNTPVQRVPCIPDIYFENGPGMYWICTDLECPEGCNSRPPNLFGLGLELEMRERGNRP